MILMLLAGSFNPHSAALTEKKKNDASLMHATLKMRFFILLLMQVHRFQRASVLGAFAKQQRNETISFVRLSFRKGQNDSHREDFREISYLRFLPKFVGRFRLWLKSDIYSTFCPQLTFMIFHHDCSTRLRKTTFSVRCQQKLKKQLTMEQCACSIVKV